MTIYDLPASSNWSKLLREYSLLNLFCKMLVPGMAQNDLLLEIVMLVSTIASDLQVILHLVDMSPWCCLICISKCWYSLSPFYQRITRYFRSEFLIFMSHFHYIFVLLGLQLDCKQHADWSAVPVVGRKRRRHGAVVAADPLLSQVRFILYCVVILCTLSRGLCICISGEIFQIRIFYHFLMHLTSHYTATYN